MTRVSDLLAPASRAVLESPVGQITGVVMIGTLPEGRQVAYLIPAPGDATHFVNDGQDEIALEPPPPKRAMAFVLGADERGHCMIMQFGDDPIAAAHGWIDQLGGVEQ